jgi:hypothetical protein
MCFHQQAYLHATASMQACVLLVGCLTSSCRSVSVGAARRTSIISLSWVLQPVETYQLILYKHVIRPHY